jgi:hypothetical protein
MEKNKISFLTSNYKEVRTSSMVKASINLSALLAYICLKVLTAGIINGNLDKYYKEKVCSKQCRFMIFYYL